MDKQSPSSLNEFFLNILYTILQPAKFSIGQYIMIAVFILIMTKAFFTKIETGQCLHRKLQKIMTFFLITQQILNESFSSSNSTEIFMRQLYVQNFNSIGLVFRELCCKLTDGRTQLPILQCTHFLSIQKVEYLENFQNQIFDVTTLIYKNQEAQRSFNTAKWFCKLYYKSEIVFQLLIVLVNYLAVSQDRVHSGKRKSLLNTNTSILMPILGEYQYQHQSH